MSAHETVVCEGGCVDHETVVRKGECVGNETVLSKGGWMGHETVVCKEDGWAARQSCCVFVYYKLLV